MKITELTAMSNTDLDMNSDVLPIVDTSAGVTKKISVSALNYPGSAAVAHDIAASCSSSFTIVSADCRTIPGCALCIVRAIIGGGAEGIPLDKVSSYNFLTLPTSMFDEAMIVSAFANTSADGSGAVVAADLPMYVDVNNHLQIKAYNLGLNNFSLIGTQAVSNGTIPSIMLTVLAVRKDSFSFS